jgi:hypothetical protein
MILTQTGLAVSGRVSLGSLSTDTVNGPIGSNDVVNVSGHIDGDPSIDVQVAMLSRQVGSMDIVLRQTWLSAGQAGSMVVDGQGSGSKASGIGAFSLTPTPNGFENRLRALQQF